VNSRTGGESGAKPEYSGLMGEEPRPSRLCGCPRLSVQRSTGQQNRGCLSSSVGRVLGLRLYAHRRRRSSLDPNGACFCSKRGPPLFAGSHRSSDSAAKAEAESGPLWAAPWGRNVSEWAKAKPEGGTLVTGVMSSVLDGAMRAVNLRQDHVTVYLATPYSNFLPGYPMSSTVKGYMEINDVNVLLHGVGKNTVLSVRSG
jgi:hypothetical protein